MSEERNDTSSCGCDDTPIEPDRNAEAEREALRRQHLRDVRTPPTAPRSSLHQSPTPVAEVTLQPPGSTPIHAIVPADADVLTVLQELQQNVRDLPRLDIGPDKGALDVYLESITGRQVKSGAVVIEGKCGRQALLLDPTTRRFRADALEPGIYTIRAGSAEAGKRVQEVEVRENDVTRAVVKLDASPPIGTMTLRVHVRGTRRDSIHVTAVDRLTGQVVYSKKLSVNASQVVLEDLPFGKLHFEFDDGSAKSCYDADVADPVLMIEIPNLELIPYPLVPPPDPPGWAFASLPREYHAVARLLPEIGIRTMDALAASEPEGLMHKASELRQTGMPPVQSQLFLNAIMSARQAIGAVPVQGDVPMSLRLEDGASLTRSFLPSSVGQVEVVVELGPGNKGHVLVEYGSRTERHAVEATQRITLEVSHRDLESRKPIKISITNESGKSVAGGALVRMPSDSLTLNRFGPTHLSVSSQSLIDGIMSKLAAKNPGLSPNQVPSVLAAENVAAWLDHARSVMLLGGVCSINDLGRFRLDPLQKLQPGLYVAPKKERINIKAVKALSHWAYAETLNESVWRYSPNEVIHDTAIVLADEWDIRGQPIIIAKEVRELLVIARQILHDSESQITWEHPDLPPAFTYSPDQAPNGGHGTTPGAHGSIGGTGDTSPSKSQNGRPDAVTPAPTVTMWILDTTNNLPPIDLNGQEGGIGGRGQDGGRGGNGIQGLRADGFFVVVFPLFWPQCCREVGFGGNGGDGGSGGRGGEGGKGGQGGAITILTTNEGLAVLNAATPAIDVNPGEGGDGGSGGSGGAPGNGAPAGTADCEPGCDEHPERSGTNGSMGMPGTLGPTGDSGLPVLSDAIQFVEITEEQWQQALTNPHILQVDPLVACPGDLIEITGANFDTSIDKIYYDGEQVGDVSSSISASFTVPLDAEGGWHPIVIRPEGMTDRRSNKVLIQILPVLDEIAPGTRWVEDETVELTGGAIRDGAVVVAEDQTATPFNVWQLPTSDVTKTSLKVTIPSAPLGTLRGVRRIKIRNPDGGESKENSRVARISDTIVVLCSAFRVVNSSGEGTPRSAAEITNFFTEGLINSLSIPWATARISFRLVQPVLDVVVDDDKAFIWPHNGHKTDDLVLFNQAVTHLAAMNFFFVRDVENATASAYYGGGPLFIGDDGGKLSAQDFQNVLAHEVGHALCVPHVCLKDGEDAAIDPSLFGRSCIAGDSVFLMYPTWPNGLTIHPDQIDPARTGASHFEDGKLSAQTNLMTADGPNAFQCQNTDLLG